MWGCEASYFNCQIDTEWWISSFSSTKSSNPPRMSPGWGSLQVTHIQSCHFLHRCNDALLSPRKCPFPSGLWRTLGAEHKMEQPRGSSDWEEDPPWSLLSPELGGLFLLSTRIRLRCATARQKITPGGFIEHFYGGSEYSTVFIIYCNTPTLWSKVDSLMVITQDFLYALFWQWYFFLLQM